MTDNFNSEVKFCLNLVLFSSERILVEIESKYVRS